MLFFAMNNIIRFMIYFEQHNCVFLSVVALDEGDIEILKTYVSICLTKLLLGLSLLSTLSAACSLVC